MDYGAAGNGGALANGHGGKVVDGAHVRTPRCATFIIKQVVETYEKLDAVNRSAGMAISTAAHATKFEFSWNGEYGYNAGATNLVTGTFEGTAGGNLISDLSNISVFINGVALNGNGSLYGSSYVDQGGGWYDWVSGGAQASFDGTQNNFLFIDADYPNNYNYTNYFYSVLGGQASYAQSPYINWNNYSYVSGTTNAGNWSVNTVGVPEPTPLALFGLGLLALARFRSKKSA